MREAYPFKGVWRWAVLPALVMSAGVVDGFAGWFIEGDAQVNSLGHWLISDVAKSAAEGAALAAGRHPAVAALTGLVLGCLGTWAEAAVYQVAYAANFVDTRPASVLAGGLGPAFTALVFHGYLRVRRRGRIAAFFGGQAFIAASILGYVALHHLRGPLGGAYPYFRWGIEEGLLIWIATVVACRRAERAAPAPAPPAPQN